LGRQRKRNKKTETETGGVKVNNPNHDRAAKIGEKKRECQAKGVVFSLRIRKKKKGIARGKEQRREYVTGATAWTCIGKHPAKREENLGHMGESVITAGVSRDKRKRTNKQGGHKKIWLI